MFAHFRDEEARKHSVLKITKPDLVDELGTPVKGRLYDPEMGPLDDSRQRQCTVLSPLIFIRVQTMPEGVRGKDISSLLILRKGWKRGDGEPIINGEPGDFKVQLLVGFKKTINHLDDHLVDISTEVDT